MAKLTAQQYAEKWGRRLTGSTADIRAGVESVTEAPGMKAAKKADKMLAGIQRAIQNGTWQKAVSSVTREQWQQAMINKGLGRIQAGVDGAMQKQVAMAEKLLANVDAVASQVNAMPDTTLEDRINKMVAFSRGMAQRKIK